MSSGTILILVVIAIVLTITMGYKLKINVGIPAIVFAYIIGVFFMKEKVSAIIEMWPVKIAFPMMTIPLFFSFPRLNGTIQIIADNLLYFFRKKLWALPVIFWFICWLLGFIGSGVTTLNAMMPAVCFSLGLSVGVPATVIAVAVCLGASSGSLTVWSGYGVITKGVVSQYFENADGVTMSIFYAMSVFTLIITVIVALITGAFKKREAIEIKKPAQFNKTQKTTLLVMCVYFFFIIGPKILTILAPNPTTKFISSALDIQMLSVIAAMICLILKLADQKEAISKGIPWAAVLMVSGMSMLLSVATKGGATALVTSWIATSVPNALIPAMFCILTGVLSYFSGAMSTAFPLVCSMAVPVAIEIGANPATVCIAAAAGASIAGVSPFSGGGSLVMSGCPDDSQGDKLFAGQLMVALAGLAFSSALTYFEFWNIFV